MIEKNLIVAFGGVSPEHEVSVLTAMQVMSALGNSTYTIVPLYITKSGRWLTGESLMDLSNFKELDTLEASAMSCSYPPHAWASTARNHCSRASMCSPAA